MGLFNKAKSFFGGKGTANVSIEPVEFDVGSGTNVMSGTMTIEALQDCTLLGTKHQVTLRLERGEESATRLLGVQSFPLKKPLKPPRVEMPCDLQAGQRVEHAWFVGGVELDRCLKKLGFDDPLDALGDPNVLVELTCTADMKGSPFDPSATIPVALKKSAFAPS